VVLYALHRTGEFSLRHFSAQKAKHELSSSDVTPKTIISFTCHEQPGKLLYNHESEAGQTARYR
jgi:hypothetical protein